MQDNMYPIVKFSRKDPEKFFKTIRKRVNSYFEENGIKKTGNAELYFKTFFMFSLYTIPFIVILSQTLPAWGMILCYMAMGLGLSGIGLCIMHDANHGSFSKVGWVNKLFSYSMNFIGSSSFTWNIQHNIMHHSFTNIYHMDEDITDKPFLRLAPEDELKPYHRFQHFYALGLYCLATISWLFSKDFRQLAFYNKTGATEKYGFSPTKEIFVMAITKILYFSTMIVLPIALGVSAWVAIGGFVLMHFIAGFIITTIFQLAHVVEGPEHFAYPEDSKVEHIWAAHQLRTTANFATGNPFITWFVGGLNHQVEHHLFPNICHVHYRDIAVIVKSTAAEFDVPYNQHKTFVGALKSHFRVLNSLGVGAI